MKRVSIALLKEQNALFMHEGELFSGVGFLIDAKRIVHAFYITNGKLVGPYTPVCAPGILGLAQLDITGLLSQDENAKYPLENMDDNFSGVGYEFQNGYCIHEILFDRGAVICDCWWVNSGVLTNFNLFEDIFHHYTWYSSGVLKSASVECAELFSGVFKFAEDGKLQGLMLYGEFFKNLPTISARTDFFPIKVKEDIALFKSAPSLYFSGNGINSDII